VPHALFKIPSTAFNHPSMLDHRLPPKNYPRGHSLQVAAGLGHTVACFADGSAFTWGLNTDGQLGLGDDASRTSPQLVDAAVLEEVDVVKVRRKCAYAAAMSCA